jgi:hypothetical protein
MEANMQNTAAELLEGADKVDNFGDSMSNLGKKLQNFNGQDYFKKMGTGFKDLGKGLL